MKYKVTYYDPELEKSVTKNCYEFYMDYATSGNDRFVFMPVDDPIKIYKTQCIYQPKLYPVFRKGRFELVAEGFVFDIGSFSYMMSNVKIEEKD